ncbi:MAG: 2-C-methyl-D-erythritol 4-phosphate cytidylyltransferase [Candidatus Eisenbacteria bacterium]|uniref:2-C-methyl-D-erythritol 4-phosphate cytidylyltransferase n=1 Tax=Eiseniibacteriota bacterium TaxID=2212470 RepID=A0A849SMG2_UNCEI|nr:2-C-methyl-D-erythritol 4-phosphate cytidylyltransferase [Candidatus Eisenbacteria bacterium]
MSTVALLLCAGRGERLGAEVGKALVPLASRPLFTWSLEALEHCRAIDAIVVVGPVSPLQHALAATGLAIRKVVAWTEGGRERQHSVARGLHVMPEDAEIVAVHDSARALVTSELIERVIEDARIHGGAIAALPMSDTVKRVGDSVILETLAREALWRAQTPQAFRRAWLVEAHAKSACATAVATDDAALVEALGHPVHVTPGDAHNLKITTPDDLALAEVWLARRGIGVTETRG